MSKEVMQRNIIQENPKALQVFGSIYTPPDPTGKNRGVAIMFGDDKVAKSFAYNVAYQVAISPDLQKCTQDSIVTSALASASMRLWIGKELGHAWLIPRRNKKTKAMEANLQIGYKGYVSKLEENGWSIECEAVTKEELEQGLFKEIRGTTPKIEHSPLRVGNRRVKENIELVYAIATKQSRKPIIAVMTRDEIEEAASTYDKQSGRRTLSRTWTANERFTDYVEMCKKTVIRRLAKLVPVRSVSEMQHFESERDMKVVKGEVSDKDEPVKKGKTNMEVLVATGKIILKVDGFESPPFETSEQAVDFLINTCMAGRPTKAARLALIEENEPLTRILIEEKKPDMITLLHEKAAEVE